MPARKSIAASAAETAKLRDPLAIAKIRSIQLDQNAALNEKKKRALLAQISIEKDELIHLEQQIEAVQSKYDGLCQIIAEKEIKREQLRTLWRRTSDESHSIMAFTKLTAEDRKKDESKLMKWMASNNIEMERGYSTNACNSTIKKNNVHE